MSDEGTTYDARIRTMPPPSAHAFVAVVGGGEPPVVELPSGRDISIGRSRSSSITLDDRLASRLHATLRWEGDDVVTLTDHGSRNGTLLDGRRVEGSVDVRSGSEIRIGEARLVVAISRPVAMLGASPNDELVVARDPAMLQALALAERAAHSDTTVLLVGETGAGKEVLAHHVHAASPRRERPFIAVNAGSIPETVAEATLFGHEQGAFTGATERRLGLFESASGGTLFLDEVGELSPQTQARLLRVLAERTITRVGGTEPVPVDVRLVAATHRDLESLVAAGRFREDLRYRLDVVRIRVPPLRERPDDIEPLARRFLAEIAQTRAVSLAPEAVEALRRHPFPGNVRELRNMLERAVAVTEADVLSVADLGIDPDRITQGGILRDRLGDAERDAIVEALEACDGNQTHAARRLGISRRALINKMERLGLKPPPRRRGS